MVQRRPLGLNIVTNGRYVTKYSNKSPLHSDVLGGGRWVLRANYVSDFIECETLPNTLVTLPKR